jgi:hypothetical protein
MRPPKKEKPGQRGDAGDGPEITLTGNRCKSESSTTALRLRSLDWAYPAGLACSFASTGRGLPQTLLARAWLREVLEALR